MKLKFKTLWGNYPDNVCVDKNGKNKPGYDNQCAVKVGYALAQSGVSFNSFKGSMCPGTEKNQGMAASAQALADWLQGAKIDGLGKAEHYTGKDAFEKIKGRTGIVFLADYWQRDQEKGTNRRSGDHIDLWNGERFTTYFSWMRIHLAIS